MLTTPGISLGDALLAKRKLHITSKRTVSDSELLCGTNFPQTLKLVTLALKFFTRQQNNKPLLGRHELQDYIEGKTLT